jgi:hypothetical protein
MGAAIAVGLGTWTGAAHAAPIAGDYGGGTIAAGFTYAKAGRFTLIGVRADPAAGSALVNVRAYNNCGVADVVRRVPLAADGSFTLRTTVRDRVRETPSVRRTARIVIFGRVAGATGSGNTRARVTYRAPGRRPDRCTIRPRAFQVRAAGPEAIPGAARPGVTYHGLTNQRLRRPRPLLLRVDRRGRRVVTTVFQYLLACRTGPISYNNITPGARIAPDGTFRRTERFRIRFANAVERFTVRVRGRFTPNGVSGTVAVTSTARTFGGRVIDRCRTGRIAFAAAP